MKSINYIAASIAIAVAMAMSPILAEETEEAADSAAEQTTKQEPGGTKKMSGMSILGNEETPKSLVIVPWKSSEMGDEMNLTDTLDDRARPVDKEVFLRELRFYEIRSNK